MKGNQRPTLQDEVIYRPKDILQLFDNFAVIDTSAHPSEGVECGAYRHFGITVFIDSTGSPTTLQLKVEFLDRWTGRWYQLKQGLFASLFWEDTDTASGITECFLGKCLGRAMRVTLVGVGTSGSAYFTVSVSAEFWN